MDSFSAAKEVISGSLSTIRPWAVHLSSLTPGTETLKINADWLPKSDCFACMLITTFQFIRQALSMRTKKCTYFNAINFK